MASVDWETRIHAWISLIICAIILTLLFNGFLVWRIKQAAGGLKWIVAGHRGPRLLTLVLLIAGDILAVLFSHIVSIVDLTSRQDYTYPDVPCKLLNISDLYLVLMLPFVYGMGLVVLALEGVVFRLRLKFKGPAFLEPPGILVSLSVSVLPWILGLVVVLPVTLPVMDLDACVSHLSVSNGRVVSGVCQILPVVATVTVVVGTICLLTMTKISGSNPPFTEPNTITSSGQQVATVCNELPPPYFEIHGSSAWPTAQSPSDDQYQTNQGTPDFTDTTNYDQETQASRLEPPSQLDHTGQSQVSNYSYQLGTPSAAQFIQSSGNNCDGQTQDLHGNLQTTTAYDQNFPQEHQDPAESFRYISADGPTPPSLSASTDHITRQHYLTKHEKISLIVATVVFVVCVLPRPIILMELVYNMDLPDISDVTFVAITDFSYLLLVTRSFMSPCMWILTNSVTYLDPRAPAVSQRAYFRSTYSRFS